MLYRDPNSKEPPIPEILARWARGGWLFKVTGSGWTRCRQQLPRDAPDAALFAAVRRMFGHQATNGGRVARCNDGERMPNPPSAGPRVLWHYTTSRGLTAILLDGEIRPSGRERGEVPAVWFTARYGWEPGASLGFDSMPGIETIRATAEAIREQDGEAAEREYLLGKLREWTPPGGWYLARIGVVPETAPYTWEDFKRVSNLPASAFEAVEARDKSIGADNQEWRVSFDPVPAAKWLALEVWSNEANDQRWEPLDWSGNAIRGT